MDPSTDSTLLFGVLIGVAWAFREVFPLLLKRRNGKHDTAYLPKDEDARREQEWWEWRRESVNKRLDSHHADIMDLRERLARLERNE